MRSSLAVRRPLTASPCLLCVLRAAAVESNGHRSLIRRRGNRRVHSSANRLAGEQLASRPEPDSSADFSGLPIQEPKFQGFLGSRALPAAAALKWGVKKAQQETPPIPSPVQPPLPEVSLRSKQQEEDTSQQATRTPPFVPDSYIQETPVPSVQQRTSDPGDTITDHTVVAASPKVREIRLESQTLDKDYETQPTLQATSAASIQNSGRAADDITSTNETFSPSQANLGAIESALHSAQSVVTTEAATVATSTPEPSISPIVSALRSSIQPSSSSVSRNVTRSTPTPPSQYSTPSQNTLRTAAGASTPSSKTTSPFSSRPSPAKPATSIPQTPGISLSSAPSSRSSKWALGGSTTGVASSSQESPRSNISSDPSTILSFQNAAKPAPSGSLFSHAPKFAQAPPPLPSTTLSSAKTSAGWDRTQTAASNGRSSTAPELGRTLHQQQSLGSAVSFRQNVLSDPRTYQRSEQNSILRRDPGSNMNRMQAGRNETNEQQSSRWSEPRMHSNSRSSEQDFYKDDNYAYLKSRRHIGRQQADPVPEGVDPFSREARQQWQAKRGIEPARARSYLEQMDTSSVSDDFKRAEEKRAAMREMGIDDESLSLDRKQKKRGGREAVVDTEWGKKSSLRARDKAKYGREFVADGSTAEETEAREAKKERKRMEKETKRKAKEEEDLAASLEPKLPPIFLPEFISISNLAQQLKVKLESFTRKLDELGFTETSPDHLINAETAGLIAMEYKFEPMLDKSQEQDLFARPVLVDKSKLPPRPPVVTIMGHVDHGKTTILDWLRKSSIVSQEYGGITQHIGAFSVMMPSGKNITFLDTPGHEAFLNMRERGANVTDIVILVVAADDSVKPQTIEAIKHAKSAGVPIIVAINKCDKEDGDPERVKSDLAVHGIEIEDVGGDTQVVCVSGKTGLGMQDLEEVTVLLSEVLDMRADKTGPCEGWVVETTTKSRGRVATVLVRTGTLKRGDIIVAGRTWAKVKSLMTENGLEVDFAGPGTPVEVDGWRDQPSAGDEVLQTFTEDKAKSVVDYRNFKAEQLQLAKDIEVINEQRRIHREKHEREARLAKLAEEGLEEPEEDKPKVDDGKIKLVEIPFIVKADVAGSVEAVVAQILTVGNNEVRPIIIKQGVGPVLESDIDLAASAKAFCMEFNVPNDPAIDAQAHMAGVRIIKRNIIYEVVDDVKRELSKFLKPTVTRKVTGEAEIAKVFMYNIRKRETKPFAGCRVSTGSLTRNARVRVMRKGEVVHDGRLISLKHNKDDVTEMKKGTECGCGFGDWDEFQEGDTFQTYEEVVTPRSFT